MEVGNLKGMGGPNNNISLGKETRPFAPFIFKMIILPRQARDKHSGKHSKKDAFLQALGSMLPSRGRRMFRIVRTRARIASCILSR